MRDYDPERDDWIHQVQPRHGCRSDQFPMGRDLCRNGMEHEYASGECVICETPDPYEDRPSLVHPYDTRDAHMCFAGCRHARTTEGRFTRPLPDWDQLNDE